MQPRLYSLLRNSVSLELTVLPVFAKRNDSARRCIGALQILWDSYYSFVAFGKSSYSFLLAVLAVLAVKEMTLDVREFTRRFLRQIMARGFVRIRQSGLLANRCRR
jgi:hypothetical protein